MGRTFFVGGNWKMNGSKKEIKELVGAWKDADTDKNTEVVIGCPAIYLDLLSNELRSDWKVAAENVYKKKSGAYTGETSVDMAKDCGIEWAILGHSERRDIFGETDEEIAEKCAFALENGLKIIPCIGEHLEERENGTTMDVCAKQLEAMAAKIKDWTNVVVAYEPVWAIGTGKVATPQQAQDTHKDIRKWLEDNVSADVAASVRILYGGSVNPGNCAELAKCPDIDGFLVGGASLKPDFTTIINANK
ncbi:triosephosphate isomerase, cytosolic [Sphaeroforma arctica JP610]|uniref:Triosephosphate isomerase n=1 Tax=Sphaeroforma arctica JP610 TaxID=667725 RepID=A0A0L0GDE0_9EUKA|nr:triosephosphate isomerase, cytosolic [Sphaeroforma arctica JP610]KNC86924.1 triosephosphate isomerase, cytosolic [Sphaeroforma arctica JP610]|eukprot:XP_014160826.1 triosephosphate isomerase, cytosolic [Sphaeroforma arctica JP610]